MRNVWCRLGRLLGVSLMLGGLAASTPVAAHPGRLGPDGCHQVTTRFVHKSGKVDEPGTRHCHRALGEMKLDGKEQLLDSPVNSGGRPDATTHRPGDREPRSLKDIVKESEGGR